MYSLQAVAFRIITLNILYKNTYTIYSGEAPALWCFGCERLGVVKRSPYGLEGFSASNLETHVVDIPTRSPIAMLLFPLRLPGVDCDDTSYPI